MDMKTQLSRRSLLQLLAAGVAGGALLPRLAAARDSGGIPARRIERIGLQLYTVRSAMAKDLEGTLAAIAAAGITELEFAGYYNKPATWWREQMKSHGMTSPSTHIGLPKTDAEWEPHFTMAKAMGHACVIVPSFGAEFRGDGGYQRLADRLNSSGELAKKSGLRVGYHNHAVELAPQASGPNGLEILLANTDPKLVDFELDLYWAVKAGHDPRAITLDQRARTVGRTIVDHHHLDRRASLSQGPSLSQGTVDRRAKIARVVEIDHDDGEQRGHDAPAPRAARGSALAIALSSTSSNCRV